MGTVKEAAESLEAKLKELGRPVTRDPGHLGETPALVIGPPALGWRGYCPDMQPTDARFIVHLVVPADELTLERLWELVPAVAAKVEELPNVALAPLDRAAQPGTFPSGGVDLPAYEISVDVAL